MKKNQLEIACFNLESVKIAQENGTNRVELCANKREGGTTPNFDFVKKARALTSIKIHIIIRPRGGNFVYSDAEFLEMKQSIILYKKLNIDGFVFGILDDNGKVNISQNKELIALANPLPCTFHRAFDEVKDVSIALEEIIDCGFSTILTSGQAEDVIAGLQALEFIYKKANNRIVIMPGGGLRSSNVKLVLEKLGTTYFHSSAIIDSGEIANSEEIQRLIKNFTI